MNSSTATTVFLPIALAVVMLGLGLSLTVADFARVVRYPRAAVVALGCQILLIPGICLALVLLFDLAPALAVGMMLLAASPGGTTANLFSHLARGDVALNITLTAINSVLAVVTLPLVVNLSLAGFMDGQDAIGLQLEIHRDRRILKIEQREWSRHDRRLYARLAWNFDRRLDDGVPRELEKNRLAARQARHHQRERLRCLALQRQLHQRLIRVAFAVF